MDTETAKLVIAAAAAGGGLIWLISFFINLKMLVGTRPPGTTINETAADITGSSTVRGNREDISRRLTSRLVGGPGNPVAPACRIIESTPEKVVFETGQAVAGYGRAMGMPRSRAEISLDQNGQEIKVSYEADVSVPRRKYAVISLCINAVGLAAVTVLPYLLWKYAAVSEKPGVRWQSVQVFQMIHVLWPPFLLTGLFKGSKRVLTNYIETLVNNLQFE